MKIKDRAKDIIISGGENISSLEVEDALYRHPAVPSAAVVAQPDEKWGETPCAFVELKPGASVTEAELIEHCRATAGGLQGAAHGRLRRAPENLDRKDPEACPAPAFPLHGGDRVGRSSRRPRREHVMVETVRTPGTASEVERVRALVRRESAAWIVPLTLNSRRPFNPLSRGLIAALQAELDALAEDATARVVVLAATGRGFCAGHDLKEMRAHTDDRGLAAHAVRPSAAR